MRIMRAREAREVRRDDLVYALDTLGRLPKDGELISDQLLCRVLDVYDENDALTITTQLFQRAAMLAGSTTVLAGLLPEQIVWVGERR